MIDNSLPARDRSARSAPCLPCGKMAAMPIRILSDQLASQIAAGEVVERPASVVKELVENALDAGARTINITIRGGGRELIQVADDGQGIPADEVGTAFQRHATSKLSSAADLERITTLGFRGEALASIAAVSRLTIITRATGETAGSRLEMSGGEEARRDTVGAPQGTVLAVEELFFNVPARLKFLKSVTTERRLIDEFVTRYAMAYPQVRFRLSHDGRITFQSTGQGNLRDVLVSVYGPEVAREMLPIAADEGREAADELESQTATVTGFVSPPSLHRANRDQIVLFVNGRPIRDSGLSYAVIQAYHTLLPTGRFPSATIFIALAHEEVDVNVHPAKTEVRFRAPGAVFAAVQRAVRQTLIAGSPVRQVGAGFTQFEQAGWGGGFERAAFGRQDAPEVEQGDLRLRWSSPHGDSEMVVLPTAPGENSDEQRLPIMRVVGQVGAAYIITEGPDGLFLIDQHAAHERILYEQFMAQHAAADGGMPSQGLVAGVVVHLTPAQATLLEGQLELLARLGFQVEPFGPQAFMVRALPALLAKLDPAQALLAVVEDLEQERAPLANRVEARIILRVCKAAAVKAGQTLSVSEMEAMIRQLEGCRNPHTCPHGRPTLIHLSAAQLARQFGRM